MQISMFGQLSGSGSGSPIDATIANLAMLRDEGFARVWMSQLPYEPDLLTVLAIALHEVDTIEVASGVVPIQNLHPMLMAQRALTLSLASGGRFTLGLGGMTHQAVTEACGGASRGTSRCAGSTSTSTGCCRCWPVNPPMRQGGRR